MTPTSSPRAAISTRKVIISIRKAVTHRAQVMAHTARRNAATRPTRPNSHLIVGSKPPLAAMLTRHIAAKSICRASKASTAHPAALAKVSAV